MYTSFTNNFSIDRGRVRGLLTLVDEGGSEMAKIMITLLMDSPYPRPIQRIYILSGREIPEQAVGDLYCQKNPKSSEMV